MEIRSYHEDDKDAVVDLWRSVGLTRSWNDPMRDIARKSADRNGWFLVGEVNGELIASAMISHDGHRGSVYYLAVSPDHRGQGYGAELMQRAEALLRDAGCPKINLLVRDDNSEMIDFYRNRGYSRNAVVCLGKRLIADD